MDIVDDSPIDTKLQNLLEKLRPFQRQCFNFATGEPYYIKQAGGAHDHGSSAKLNAPRPLQHHGRVLLADEMGLGKTVTSLAIMLKYYSEWPLLILCPSSLRYMWPSEIEKFVPSLPSSSIYVISGFDDVDFVHKKGIKIIVASYSILQKRSASAHALLHNADFHCVIADESHNLKEKNSQRCALALPLLAKAHRLILMSGTPALARPAELWPQLHCLDKEEFYSFTKFTQQYCNAKRGRFGEWDVKGISNVEELHAKIQKVMVRHLKSNVLTELPAKQRTIVPVKIDSTVAATIDCKEAIENMHHLHRTVQDSNEDALHANFEARKLLMNAYQMTGISKAPAVADFILDYLSGSNEKVIVFGHHKEVLTIIEDAISRKFKGVGHIKIDGGVAPLERSHRVKKFQTCETIRVALLSVTAAGVGLTLTAASAVIFAELHWTPGVLAQAEDRCHRIGQTNAVNIMYCICKDESKSVDMTLWRMLSRKVGNVARLVDGTKGASLDARESPDAIGTSDKHSDKGISGEEELSSFFAQQQNEKCKHKSIAVKGTIQSYFQKGIGKSESDILLNKASCIPFSAASASSTFSHTGEQNQVPEQAVCQSWICDICTYINPRILVSGKMRKSCEICGSQKVLVQDVIDEHKQQEKPGNSISARLGLSVDLAPSSFTSNRVTAITPCRGTNNVDEDFTLVTFPEANTASTNMIDLTRSDDEEEENCLQLHQEKSCLLSFSVSKNTGRISIHSGLTGASLSFNFDINDVITRDSLQDIGQAKTKRLRGQTTTTKAEAQRIFDTKLNYIDDESLMQNGKPNMLPSSSYLEICKDELKHFIASYLTFSESEKKLLTEISDQHPVNSWSVNQAVENGIAASEYSNLNCYDRYSGGAKERAMEKVKHDGIASTSISQLDKDLLNGLACAWCASYLSNRSEGVEATYCSIKCVDEGRLKRGGKYASRNIRRQLFALEKGVCRHCNIDAHSLFVRIMALHHPTERLNALLNANWVLPVNREALDRMLTNPTEGDFWQADHVKAVAAGGGNASLSNLRTLCAPCHKKRN